MNQSEAIALMDRWGLGHLRGRDKSQVDVVSRVVSKRRKQ